ncbi:hypothetical protein EDB86DRAFT_2826458 [Lactarius hatsudake]|nr:hypothetical protein EDB86DRAFT_2826458 [Lactarius hatsudake]
MTAAAVFDATCPATPTPLTLALAWTSRPSRCPRAAPQFAPTHDARTTRRRGQKVRPIYPGVRCWDRPLPPPLPARPRDPPRSQPPLLTIDRVQRRSRRVRPQAIALPARKPVRPDTGISITTMAILNSFVNDIRPSSPRPDTGISNKTEAMNSFVNDICPLLTITHAQRCSQRDRLQVRPAYLGDRCPLTRPRSSHPRTRCHSHSAHRYFQQDRGHPEGHPELLCQRHFRTVCPVYLGDRYLLAPLTLARDATHTVHTGISNKTAAILKAILNSFVNDIFERFVPSTSVTVTRSCHRNPDCCSSHPQVGCLNHKAVALPARDTTQTGALRHWYFHAVLNSFVNDIFERIAKNPPYRQGKSRLLFI